jgi:hypothetical protein
MCCTQGATVRHTCSPHVPVTSLLQTILLCCMLNAETCWRTQTDFYLQAVYLSSKARSLFPKRENQLILPILQDENVPPALPIQRSRALSLIQLRICLPCRGAPVNHLSDDSDDGCHFQLPARVWRGWCRMSSAFGRLFRSPAL